MKGILFQFTILRILILAATSFCSMMATQLTLVEAQTPCTGIAPPVNATPLRYSWPQNQPVAVKLDDTWTNQSDRNALDAGVKKWNDSKIVNCSNVTFGDAQAQHFTDYAAAPPAYTVYVQRVTVALWYMP